MLKRNSSPQSNDCFGFSCIQREQTSPQRLTYFKSDKKRISLKQKKFIRQPIHKFQNVKFQEKNHLGETRFQSKISEVRIPEKRQLLLQRTPSLQAMHIQRNPFVQSYPLGHNILRPEPMFSSSNMGHGLKKIKSETTISSQPFQQNKQLKRHNQIRIKSAFSHNQSQSKQSIIQFFQRQNVKKLI